MRTAFDLRYATDHFTGIGTHAFCLLEALLELPGEERWVVLWDPRLPHRRFELERLRRHPRIEWHERRIAPLAPAGPWQVGAWLREARPDAYLSPYFFRPEGAPCPCAVTIHDVWPLRLREGLSPLRHAIYRWSLSRARGAAAIVTSSEFSRREIVELVGAPLERVHAIRLGVPRPGSDSARRPGRAPDGAYALVVGDNRPRKNLATLAAAWAMFGESPPLELVAAGPALERFESLEAMASRAGARGVRTLGWVEETELEWLYRHAAVVLFPSLYEGFGFPLAEAFARGVPSIAADIPTLREIGEGVTEFLPATEPRVWSEAVARLVASPEARERASAAARSRASELTYRATAERTLALMRALAGVPGVPQC